MPWVCRLQTQAAIEQESRDQPVPPLPPKKSSESAVVRMGVPPFLQDTRYEKKVESRKETTSDTPAVTDNSGRPLSAPPVLRPHWVAARLQSLRHAVHGTFRARGAQVLEQSIGTVPCC